jgi:hypothetical protein
VSDWGPYIGFLVLTLIGAMLPMLMADPKKVSHAHPFHFSFSSLYTSVTEVMIRGH